MIGQKNLCDTLDNLIITNKFPRFTILVGLPGSGRKVICDYIGKKLNATVYKSDIKVDSVREVISNAYKCVGSPVIYVFPDSDNMSPAAKNALLKVTEEPPKNAYIIMTLSNLNSVYATIRSRGTVLYMDDYTSDEIDEYYHNYFSSYSDVQAVVNRICLVPGDVDKLISAGAVDFYEFVVKVIDNIAVVSGCNSFKIANAIKFKETDTDKYDLRLFWRAFMSVCIERLSSAYNEKSVVDAVLYCSGIKITARYMQELNITGINKQSTFDAWLLDIRKAWRV